MHTLLKQLMITLKIVPVVLILAACSRGVSEAPTGTPDAFVQASGIDEAPDTPSSTDTDMGSISGTLSYPSEVVPALDVYAFNIDDPNATFYTVSTDANQTTFTIRDVAPGTYHVVAYLADTPDAQFAGGYTAFVTCGLTVDCTDHTLIPVPVQAGVMAEDIAVQDWYAPDGTFPARP